MFKIVLNFNPLILLLVSLNAKIITTRCGQFSNLVLRKQAKKWTVQGYPAEKVKR